jgi:hypothetical protein
MLTIGIIGVVVLVFGVAFAVRRARRRRAYDPGKLYPFW